jgi:hypothetical protein
MADDMNENTGIHAEQPSTITTGGGAPLSGTKGPVPAQLPAPGNDEHRWMQEHEKPVQYPAGQSPGPGNVRSVHSPAGKPRLKRVERKTYLRGQSIDPPWQSKQSVRRQTERNLNDNDSDIPYTVWEKATRSIVCSLIERQDRLFEQFLLLVNDLQYRVDDIEQDLEEIMQKKGRER